LSKTIYPTTRALPNELNHIPKEENKTMNEQERSVIK
jgi:hypothetical protein